MKNKDGTSSAPLGSLEPAMVVNLEWAQNTESDVVLYTMYWGTSPGVYTFSQATVDITTSMTLSGLRDGITYYFAITAQDNSLNESALSDEVSKINKVIRVRL